MTPTIGSIDLNVFSDTYAALFDKIGTAILVTHSQGGGVGWLTLPKTKNIKAIVAYEPGTNVPFLKGKMPEEGKVPTLSKKTEGVEVPMSVFMEFTKSRLLFISVIICRKQMSTPNYMNGHAVCTSCANGQRC